MNVRKIFSSILTIGVVGSALAGATYALFTSQATSQDNTFSTGNASLLIANDVASPGSYSDSISGFSATGLIPGSTTDKLFWLKNDSTGGFSMDVKVSLADLKGTVSGDLPGALLVQFSCDTVLDSSATFTSSTVERSVNDWIADVTPEALATVGVKQSPLVPATSLGSDQDELLCKMSARLPSTTTDVVAGETLSFDGVFDATQVAP